MAEFWFRKATALIPEKERKKDLEAPTLFQKVRVKRIYGPLTVDYPVKVDFTDYGRAVYATDTLEPGKLIHYLHSITFVERPSVEQTLGN
jgi:hypothetical protein